MNKRLNQEKVLQILRELRFKYKDNNFQYSVVTEAIEKIEKMEDDEE